MKYLCSRPDHGPDSWTEVEAYDREHAAIEYAKQLCARDSEIYSSFSHGGRVLVKIVGGKAQTFYVTLEMLPYFSARPRL